MIPPSRLDIIQAVSALKRQNKLLEDIAEGIELLVNIEIYKANANALTDREEAPEWIRPSKRKENRPDGPPKE